jgi:hypothetical protein
MASKLQSLRGRADEEVVWHIGDDNPRAILQALSDWGTEHILINKSGHWYEGWIFEVRENDLLFANAGPMAPPDPFVVPFNDIDLDCLGYVRGGEKPWPLVHVKIESDGAMDYEAILKALAKPDNSLAFYRQVMTTTDGHSHEGRMESVIDGMVKFVEMNPSNEASGKATFAVREVNLYTLGYWLDVSGRADGDFWHFNPDTCEPEVSTREWG